MTLIEVIDASRSLLNEPLDASRTFPDNTSSFWRDADLITYFNIAQQDISLEIVQAYEDYFLTQSNLSIVANQSEYALPTGFMKMRRVEDLTSQPNPTEIWPLTINERPARGPYGQNTSGSYWLGGYYMKGNYIVLTDTPTVTDTSAIRIYFIKALADVTAGSDTSQIPVEFHKLLVWGTVRYALFQQQSDTTRADLEYEKMLQRLRSQAESRQIQKPRKVKNSLRGRWTQ